MFHKITSVKPLPNFNLAVKFVNGENRNYDVSLLFNKWEAFKSLLSIKGLFKQVRVDAGGFGISWNDELDLSCDELYYNGK